jgi:hypothetical protein
MLFLLLLLLLHLALLFLTRLPRRLALHRRLLLLLGLLLLGLLLLGLLLSLLLLLEQAQLVLCQQQHRALGPFGVRAAATGGWQATRCWPLRQQGQQDHWRALPCTCTCCCCS